MATIKELLANLGDATTQTAAKEQTPDAEAAKKWQAAAKKLAPMLKDALKSQTGDVRKMRAVFAFAKEKADSGEYPSALKALVKLKQLIDEGVAASKGPEAEWRKTADNAIF